MLKQFFGALIVAMTLTAQPVAAQPVDAARFVDPVSARSASISPGGGYVAYVARNETAQSVVVVDLAARSRRQVAAMPIAQGRINWVQWKDDGRLILGATAYMGFELSSGTGSHLGGSSLQYTITRMLAVNRDGSNLVQMFEGRMAQLSGGYGSTFLLDTLPNEPGQVLLSAWDNNGHGVWRGDVNTGRVTRVADGSRDTMDYYTDGTGYPVLRIDAVGRSGYRVSRRAPGERNWTFYLEVRRVATATNSPDFEALGPGPGPGQVYVLARPDGRDFAGLYLFNTATGELGEPAQEGVAADVTYPWITPSTHEIFATCEFAQRMNCQARDRSMQRHLNAVAGFFDNNATITLVDMSQDTTKWLLHVDGPTESGGFYLYDRTAARVEAIVAQYPNLDPQALSPTQIVSYQSRDGAPLWAYVTAQPGTGPRPTVIMPHGGPEARDYYGYDGYVQFLASRGYVVVQPNFRGSLGFGRAFADQGRQQWGLRMQDDVTDAVRHMIEAGIADPQRICIVGASYGGYAALTGVALTPELYRCAISIAGVSDLTEMLRDERAEGRDTFNYHYWLRSIGDPRANRDALLAVSPARLASRISAPVLLLHGEVDDTVLIRHSEIMQEALQAAGKPTRFVRLPDADHYWDNWSSENRLILFRESEAFLAQNLAAH